MRFLMIVKATKQSEAGVMPTEQELAEMAKYNEQLVKSGAMLDGAGLHPSREGVRINFDTGKPRVIDGPFAETKEQLLGFYVVDCESLEEALDFARDLGKANPGGAYEIRPLALFNPRALFRPGNLAR
jgi:hypothetical protein